MSVHLLRATSADSVLDLFFQLQRAEASGRKLARLDAAEADLRRCFDAESDAILTTDELTLRDAEREFGMVAPAASVAAPDALLMVLPIYLDDPRWQGADREDRRLRAQLALPLAQMVARLPQLRDSEVGCALWSVQYAVERALVASRALRRA